MFSNPYVSVGNNYIESAPNFGGFFNIELIVTLVFGGWYGICDMWLFFACD